MEDRWRETDLQEDGRVLLIELNQLDVGDGVDDAHGQPGHRHDHCQQQDIVAQRDDGKDYRDEQGGDKETRQGAE